ncbi:MAG: hypothetical protein ABR962_05490 [Candidatus Bathyarchaeia archaeon]
MIFQRGQEAYLGMAKKPKMKQWRPVNSTGAAVDVNNVTRAHYDAITCQRLNK